MIVNIVELIGYLNLIVVFGPFKHVVSHPLVSLGKEAFLNVSLLKLEGATKRNHLGCVNEATEVLVFGTNEVSSIGWDISEVFNLLPCWQEEVCEII